MQKDLLRDAIADAKAVRQTALANAKLALEEAFAPRLQSMLSAKLAEELSDDEEMTNEFETPEYADNDQRWDEGEDNEADDMDDMDDDAGNDEDEDDLDLDEIIRELEEEEDTDSMYEEDEDMEDMDEVYEMVEDEDMEDMDEVYEMVEDEDMEDMDEVYEMVEDEDMEDMDEDIDINEIVRALHEDDDDMEDDQVSKEELEEAYNVIRFMKNRLNEVNLLNAKLLYSNKLFRNYNLNQGQKMKVIEHFDKAHNLREVKLVYSTLSEGFNIPSNKKVVKESYASKPIGSTKPTKHVITEGTELAERFKKLAGLK